MEISFHPGMTLNFPTCINCHFNPAPVGELCEACSDRMIANIMAQISAEDQQKPVDELAPRVIEFKVK
jgi:hypothetical protein